MLSEFTIIIETIEINKSIDLYVFKMREKGSLYELLYHRSE